MSKTTDSSHSSNPMPSELAFVDAAIDFYRASMEEANDHSAKAAPIKVNPDCWVDVALATAVLAYHAYKSLPVVRDMASEHTQGLNIGTTVSLSEMIERRNRIAVALGQKEIA